MRCRYRERTEESSGDANVLDGFVKTRQRAKGARPSVAADDQSGGALCLARPLGQRFSLIPPYSRYRSVRPIAPTCRNASVDFGYACVDCCDLPQIIG
jgi:hypothetical protein